jgi:hypothetical protein
MPSRSLNRVNEVEPDVAELLKAVPALVGHSRSNRSRQSGASLKHAVERLLPSRWCVKQRRAENRGAVVGSLQTFYESHEGV